MNKYDKERLSVEREIEKARLQVAEENAALYKGRMQAAETYYKDMVNKMMLVLGMCPVCEGKVVIERRPCNCKVENV